jgi:hypothetical protein
VISTPAPPLRLSGGAVQYQPMKGFTSWAVLVSGSLLWGGCGQDAPPTGISGASHRDEPIGMQMSRAVPDLRGQRYTNLLHFEASTDSVFVAPSNLTMDFDDSHAHTGKTALKLRGDSGKLAVRLASLLGDRPFPADWTLGGAYFYSEQPAQITVLCEVGGRLLARNGIELPANQWAAAMVDLSNPLESARSFRGTPSISFIINTPGAVWCDDVLLIDNTQWIIGDEASAADGQWSLRRLGFSYICEKPSTFSVRLPTVESSPSGWRVDEHNDFRARFSSTGRNKTLTIYSDGRSYWDGQYRFLAAALESEPLYAQQPHNPGEIEIAETMGRVERRSSGDENNDGYNEARAAYMLIASGPRLEFTVSPRAVPILRPVFEITGLPEGKPLVTVEGRLVEQVLRLDDGTLLVEIPAKMTRPTTVNLRIQ